MGDTRHRYALSHVNQRLSGRWDSETARGIIQLFGTIVPLKMQARLQCAVIDAHPRLQPVSVQQPGTGTHSPVCPPSPHRERPGGSFSPVSATGATL